MSLIEEALRRTQEKPKVSERPQAPPSHPPIQHHDAPLPATSPPSLRQPPQQQAPSRSGERLGLVLIGLIGLAFWMARGRISLPRGSMAPPIVQPQRAAHVTVPGQAVERPVQQPPAIAATPTAVPEPIKTAREPMGFQRPPPQLQLNGVIEGSGEPLALINGSLVRLGETIEGATLLEVKEGSARLRWLNQELVLRTTR